MAEKEKDPATLWYWADWFSGTVTFSRHLKGCYMDLLHAQFNNGALSLSEIKTVLGVDFPSWKTLSKKFTQDENGNYYNVKADKVKKDREAFLQKQKANGEKGGRPPNNPKYNPKVKPNITKKENENVIENEILTEKEKGGVGESFISKFQLHEIHAEALMKDEITLSDISYQTKQQVTPEVLKIFNAHLRTEETFHPLMKSYKSHLRNWIFTKPDARISTAENGFPNGYSSEFETKLETKKLPLYWAHLKTLGLSPKKNSKGVTVDWVKPQPQ